ncbi:hypothetical protein HMPREF0645_2018 [Hallella bergensis DSM 17361]|uniref:Uncharacterized protein n=1 Tax=Hallella bergensis DSM 17361 TaxID=585502 RepID=D1PYI3_9BACT|nr:hypothetical protein HMPREF0645_2018 [Hallella bergensis DSM 17361]
MSVFIKKYFYTTFAKAMVLSYNDRMIPMTYCYDGIDLSIRPFKIVKYKYLFSILFFRSI